MAIASGPTQMDEAAKRASSQSDSWEGRPRLAKAIRLFLWVLPLVSSLLFGVWASISFPPEVLGLNRWLWWAGLVVIATILTKMLERLTRRLTPLALLMRLTLIFPDQAPSRFSAALRAGTTAATKKRLAEIHESGRALTAADSVAAQMIDLVAMLSAHDRRTRGHAERVRGYTDLLAEEMGIVGEDAGKLRWAALLHDMGKLSVPAEILNKPGRPDAEEWKILSGHPAAARVYLAPISDWLGVWGRAADGHHERWDGGGYPAGLAGAGIPLSARMVAVADAYDVMTSTRSYKKPMPAEVARREIAANAGSQFDPQVVRAFLNIGLGELRRITGPLAWVASLPGARNLPIGNLVSTATAPVISAAAAAAIAISGAVVPAADPVPEQLAFRELVEVVETAPAPTTTEPMAPTSTTTTTTTSTTSTTTTTSTTSTTTTTSTPASPATVPQAANNPPIDADRASTTTTVVVVVPDVNEPPFSAGLINATVQEHSTPGVVAVASATDPDGDPLSYAIVPGAHPFKIDAQTGAITLLAGATIDFEAVPAGEYALEIVAFDPDGLSTTIPVRVRVVNIADGPTIDPAAFVVSEAESAGHVVGEISWSDIDGANHSVEIIGGNDDTNGNGVLPFTIQQTSTNRTSTLRLLDAGDVSFGERFALEIRVTDTAGQTHTEIVDVTVTPRFTLSPQAGALIFNEVLWADASVATGENTEFVELFNPGPVPVDISGFTLADSDVVNGEREGSRFSFVVPAGTAPIQPGQYVVVWTGSAGAAPDLFSGSSAFEGYANAAQPVLSSSDDLLLFDANNQLVSYVAWGAQGTQPKTPGVNEIGTRPPLNYGLWDNDSVGEGRLGATWTSQLRSISLSLNGDLSASRSAQCWEPSAAVNASAATCANGPLQTFDTDPVSATRRTSLGVNNNLPQYTNHLVISEYTSAASSASTGEFIEIYNPSNLPVDLSDFRLEVITGVSDTSIQEQLGPHILQPGQYYLLTNTANTALPVAPDQRYPFSLENRAGIRIRDVVDNTVVDQVGNSQSFLPGNVQLIEPRLNPYREGDGISATETIPGVNMSNQRRSYGVGSCVDSSTNPENNRFDFIRNFEPDPQNTASTLPCGVATEVNPAPASGIVISEFRPNGLESRVDDAVTLFNASSAAVNIGDYHLYFWDGRTMDLNGNGLPEADEYRSVFLFPNTILAPGQRFRIAHENARATTLVDVDGTFTGNLADGGVSHTQIILVRPDGSVADTVNLGFDPNHWSNPLPYADLFQARSWIRRHGGCQDSDIDLADFEYAFAALELGFTSAPTPCP